MPNSQIAETDKPGIHGKPDPIDILSAFKFPTPSFAFSDIRQLGDRITKESQGAIASEALLAWSPPCFSEGREMIMDQFNLHEKNHFFHARPIEWASFHEPQITKGFAYFLDEDNQDGDGRRIRAFLQAFGIDGVNERPNFQIEAEAQTKTSKRIDLQICWNGEGTSREALIIEAKFGHIISNDQLASYEQHAFDIPRINKDKIVFFVLSPGSNAQHSRLVSQNKKWKEISWAKVLISYQNRLPESADDDEFGRFRRTVWHRALN